MFGAKTTTDLAGCARRREGAAPLRRGDAVAGALRGEHGGRGGGGLCREGKAAPRRLTGGCGDKPAEAAPHTTPERAGRRGKSSATASEAAAGAERERRCRPPPCLPLAAVAASRLVGAAAARYGREERRGRAAAGARRRRGSGGGREGAGCDEAAAHGDQRLREARRGLPLTGSGAGKGESAGGVQE